MTTADALTGTSEGPGDAVNVPRGLQTAGARLWQSLTADYDFDEHELIILLQACRTSDNLDRLNLEALVGNVTVTNSKGDEIANPALTEGRQQSLALARLIASLRLPSGEEDDTRPQRRGGARGSYGVRTTA